MHRPLRAVLPAVISFAFASGLHAQTPRLGTIEFPTSATGDAQKHFITGVLYLHSFEYESAAAAFQRAQRIDPGFAFAYWGEAMTYTHPVWDQQDTAAGRAALRRLAPTPAGRLAKARTPRERAYLGAVEILYGEGSKVARDTAYSFAMERVAAEFREDMEAKSFYALSLLGLSQGTRDVPTYMRAGAIVEEVFNARPRHPGAAHYVIHSFDDPVHAPLGLRAARAYSTIAPDAAHAQHMTSHIFLALGMWEETVRANEVASTATRDTASGAPRRSCGHYGEWLHYAYFQQGRPVDATLMFEECRVQSAGARGARMRHSLAGMRAVQIIESEQWDGPAVRLAIDTVGLPTPARILIDFGTGYAAAKRGDTATAAASLATLSERSASATDFRGYGEIMGHELRALLALAAGRSDDAVVALKRAVGVEEMLPVDFGPPLDVKPPRELLGETLLRLGRTAEARRELERQLARTPRRALTLARLAEASRINASSAAPER